MKNGNFNNFNSTPQNNACNSLSKLSSSGINNSKGLANSSSTYDTNHLPGFKNKAVISDEAIRNLCSTLLTILNPESFFLELARFIQVAMNIERVVIYKILPDLSAVLVSIYPEAAPRDTTFKLLPGSGIVGQVTHTKRAYYGPNLKRDPIYNPEHYDPNFAIYAELCVPIISNNALMATINLQSTSPSKQTFDYSDVNTILHILSEIKSPLSNLQMYMTAKELSDALLSKVQNTEKELRQRSSDSFSRKDINASIELIGNSSGIREIVNSIDNRQASNNRQITTNIFLCGESGSGKRLLAEYIHSKYCNPGNPLINLDCAITKAKHLDTEITALEDAYFAASSGTLLLLNVEHLSTEWKSWIEEKINNSKYSSKPVGNIISLSNLVINEKGISNEESKVSTEESGIFSLDSFLLNSFKIKVPALRERTEDIPVLISHFLKLKGSNKSISGEALELLNYYSWPQNISELKKVIDCADYVSNQGTIYPIHLPYAIRQTKINYSDYALTHLDEVLNSPDLKVGIDELEKRYIRATLKKCGGNKTKTAALLGITVKTLYNKIHYYGMSGDE